MADGLVLAGGALALYGVSRLSLTAACLVAGVVLVAAGLLVAWRHG